jgi:hypothetical protein
MGQSTFLFRLSKFIFLKTLRFVFKLIDVKFDVMIIVEGRDYVMFDVLLSLSPDAKEWTGLKPKIAEIKDKDKYFISSISKRKSKLTGKIKFKVNKHLSTDYMNKIHFIFCFPISFYRYALSLSIFIFTCKNIKSRLAFTI